MRIATRLQLSAAFALVALVAVAPWLSWALASFTTATKANAVADQIYRSFYERASARDQYFLYREDHAREQWEQGRARISALIHQAEPLFDTVADRKLLQGVSQAADASELVFQRLVSNTQAMQASPDTLAVREELHRRLYSQLLLKATDLRNAIHALDASSAEQLARAYQHLVAAVFVLALLMMGLILFNAVQIGALIRHRLIHLNQGAERISSGDLAHRIDSAGADEFSEIAQSINRMTQLLQGLTQNLEDQVRDRTAKLQRSESYLRAVIEAEPECIKIVGADGRLQQMNTAGLSMIEADSLEQVKGRRVAELLAPEYRDAFSDMHRRVLQGASELLEFEVIGLKGGRRCLETHAAPLDLGGERVQLAVTRDISGRKKAAAKLELAASVFSHAREGIMITDADGVIIDVNEAFTRITGFERDEALNKTPRILSSGRQDKAFYVTMWRELKAQGYWTGELWNRRRNGEVYAELLTISAVSDGQGGVRQYVALFSDITVSKEQQKRLEHIAHFDALTNLPNRVMLADRLSNAMAQARRRHELLAVVYLDLDGFKAINDHHGHAAGDHLLISLAGQMKQALREGDTLARLGGDEFVAVLIDLGDGAGTPTLLARLLSAAASEVQLGDLFLSVSASLGVTFYPQPADIDAEQLLRQADQAMYQAKLAGKNRYHFFDAAHDLSLREHHEGIEHIRLGLQEGEFILHYQPKVNLRTGVVVGAEALIRWQHPHRGLLAPGAFLPLIEEHPLAVTLGEWVIDQALTQMAFWRAQGLVLPVSVNVSARQLQQRDFLERLSALLAAHPSVPPGSLQLEVLETSALEDVSKTSELIQACASLGVSFALDDFGTGYSSLTYLKRLQVAELKIDQSFVRDMLSDPDDLAILKGVIGMARAFKREVIAEGVETQAHASCLLEIGCELAQGYGISRPLPPQQILAWVARWRSEPAWTMDGHQTRGTSEAAPGLTTGNTLRGWPIR